MFSYVAVGQQRKNISKQTVEGANSNSSQQNVTARLAQSNNVESWIIVVVWKLNQKNYYTDISLLLLPTTYHF